MGQWAERADGSWTWDATPADPSVTRIMSAYSGGVSMTEHPTRRDVYDPRLGADGGGRYAEYESDPIPAIDPDNPVEHVDQLRTDGPESWIGSDPSLSPLGRQTSLDEHEQLRARNAESWASPDGLVCCPRCGSGVHRDRLNSGD